MPAINLSEQIQINKNWVSNQLDSHILFREGKLVVRLYTIKPSGTQLLMEGLCTILHEMLPFYVYSAEEIAKKGEMWAGLNAKGYFGLKNPQTDGKYGELLLFALVEALLNCKMVAHKIRSLSNVRDQVKGGDGIFLGEYEIDDKLYPAYLIGESKITSSFATGLAEALESINRFTSEHNNVFLERELIIAKDCIKLVTQNIDDLYDRLTPNSEEFKKQVLVHPILIAHNSQSIGTKETEAKHSEHLSELISGVFKNRETRIVDAIKQALNGYDELKKVYLDFFIMPCNSIDVFRNTLFEKIHGIPYNYSTVST